MKRKSLLFLLLFALLAPWAAMAQETTFTVYANQTGTNSNIPIYGLWADANQHSEFIIPAADLADIACGTISKLTFHVSSKASKIWNGTAQIYLKEVSETTFATPYAYYGTEGATIVYEGGLDAYTSFEMAVPFTEDVTYTYGGGNLLVGLIWTTGGNYGGASFYGKSATGASISHYGSNSPSAQNFIPRVTFTYTPSPYAPPATIAYTNNEPGNTTVSWTAPNTTETVTGYKYRYKKTAVTDWDGWYTLGASTTSGTLAGLDYSTEYEFEVKAVYGENESCVAKSVTFTTLSDCMVPENLTITNVTWNSATFNWTEGFGQGSWTFGYKKTTEEAYTTMAVAAADLPLTLEVFEGNTAYDVEIYPNCDATKFLTDQFTTKCNPTSVSTVAYEENFNDYTGNATSTTAPTDYPNHTLPDCWTFLNMSASSSTYPQVFLTSYNTYAVSGNCLFFKSSNTTPLYASLPLFEEAISGLQLSFTYRNEGTGDYNGTLYVGYMTNPDDESTFHSVYTCPQTTTKTDVEVLFENAPTNSYIAFKYAGGTSNNYYLSIDDVMVEPIPSCGRPSALAYSNRTNHSVKISWNAHEGQTAWQIAYSKTSFDPNADGFDLTTVSTVDVAANPYLFDKTLDADAYYMYVRANCGTAEEPDYSKWSKTGVNVPSTTPVPTPSGLTVTNVGPTTADVYWNAGGGDFETEWEIVYTNDPEFNITTDYTTEMGITVTTLPTAQAPYPLAGLTAETSYRLWVRGNNGTDGNSSWVGPKNFTTLVACPTPTTKPVTNLQPYSATLNWTGYSESYNVRYREVPQADTVFSESFDGGSIPSGWTNQSGWTVQSSYVKHTSSSGGGSYYLIMPAMDFSTYSSLALSFNYKTPYYSSSYPDDIDGFGVYYRVNGGEWNELFYEVALHNDWTEKTLPLTGLAANYEIGFRMVNNWGGGVFIDEIVVLSLPEAPWISANNGEPIEVTSVDIAELADSTRYEWQVQATCANDWTASAYFTTPWACTAPVADSATNITYNSANLYWTGYQDEYNVRYRTAETVDIFLQTGYLATNYNWSGWTSNSPGGSYQSGLYYLDEDHTMVGWVFVYNESVTPQYRISREMTPVVSGTTLQFYAGLYDDTDEVLTVGFSSTDNAVASFTWNEEPVALTTAGGYFAMAVPEGTKYIAFQHVSGEDALYLFDVTVYANYVPEGEWEYANNVTSPTTIDELLDDTWYEWQVQGNNTVCTGDTTAWSQSDYFQTKKAYIQTVELTEGWNWFSTYIDVEDNNIFDQLKAGLGTSGLQIASQGNGASTYRNGRWMGTVTIKNESGYKIKTSAAVTFTIVGSQYADPAECPITIKPSWNWIGYPVSEPQTVTTAMAGFDAANNDQIKTLGGGATYRSGRWMSPTYTLVPGKSYAYKSNASENKTLFFPNVESTAKSEPTKAAPNKQVKPFRAMNEAPLLKKGFLGKPIEKQ